MKKTSLILLLVGVMALSLVGCGEKAPAYVDGSYNGVADGHGGPVEVEVTVADGKISDVQVISHSETEGISDPAIAEVPAAIVEKNSTDVDVVANATKTSEAIKAAVANALEGAK